MLGPAPLHLASAFALFTLTACAGDTPTQPSSDERADVAAPSFAYASNSWTARAPLPGTNARIGMTAASVRNSAGQSIVYVFGGYMASSDGSPGAIQASSILAYNVSTNTWTTKKAQFVRSFSNGAAVINGKVYISGGIIYNAEGGYSDSNTLWMYDPATDRMIQKANMPRRTSRGVSGVIGGKLYVLAGACSDCANWTDVRRLDRYDPATNSWRTFAAAPHRHMGGNGGVINEKFYVAGGSGSAYLDVFNPATKSWTTLAPMPVSTPGGGGRTAAVLKSKLYVVAGSTYAYNPATNAWNLKARYPSVGPHAVTAVQLNGSPHALGVGGSSDGGGTPSQLYTP
jgi:N-acetylneuraminic acid mutarotase